MGKDEFLGLSKNTREFLWDKLRGFAENHPLEDDEGRAKLVKFLDETRDKIENDE